MIVCHCHGITDHTIRQSVREGADSCARVARLCRAGGGCGGCRPAIQDIIDGELAGERCSLLVVTARSELASQAG